jgi:hypothetical protein
MNKTRTALLALLILFSAPSFADELTPQKRADIEQLLQMTGALAMGKQMSAMVVGQMTQMLRKARPDIPDRVIEILPEEVDGIITDNMGNLKELVIPLYHKHFTADDIKGLMRFYASPLGQKTIQAMPLLMNESMQVGQQWGQALGPEIQTRIRARLKKEGFEL